MDTVLKDVTLVPYPKFGAAWCLCRLILPRNQVV